MKKDTLQEIEEQQLRRYSHVMEWWTAELLDRLQNGTHRGKGGAADQ
jgi:hypothetical protein